MDEIILRFETKAGEDAIKLEPEVTEIDLSYRRIIAIDLRPLAKCRHLQGLDLSYNMLTSIDLWPLMKCRQLSRLSLRQNPLTSIDVTPLFACPRLSTVEIDPTVDIHADYKLGMTSRRPRPLDGLRRRRLVKWNPEDESMDPLAIVEQIKNKVYSELSETYKGPDTESLVDETLKYNIVEELEKKIREEIAKAEEAEDYKRLFLLERGLEYIQNNTP